MRIRKEPVLILLIFVFLLQIFSCSRQTALPNIVLILFDDMGFSDLGCYGGEIMTPNIDHLAEEGILHSVLGLDLYKVALALHNVKYFADF